LDDASVTQPQLQREIDSHTPVLAIYKEQLLAQGVITQEDIEAVEAGVEAAYQGLLEASVESDEGSPDDWVFSQWRDTVTKMFKAPGNPTGLPLSVLQDVGQALTEAPEGFNLHPEVDKLLTRRRAMADGLRGIDMSFAEQLACGTLLLNFEPEDDNYEQYVTPHPTAL